METQEIEQRWWCVDIPKLSRVLNGKADLRWFNTAAGLCIMSPLASSGVCGDGKSSLNESFDFSLWGVDRLLMS